MAQKNKNDGESIPERLRRYQVSEGIPWRLVAERLGISLSMVMMVLRGERNLSAKALFRLEQAERAAAQRKSIVEKVVETLIGGRDVAARVIGEDRTGKGVLEVPVDYVPARSKASLPAAIPLAKPSEQACQRLQKLFVETLDTKLIALSCLPESLRTERFLEQLAAESRARLINAALDLVIPDWRTLVLQST